MRAARRRASSSAEIDLGKVAEARKMVPSLQHDRKYAAPALHKAAVAKAAE